MTYQPGNPGYPPAQQPGQYGNQYGGPTQQFNRVPEQIPAAPAAPAGPSKLPEYLTIAVAALGLLIFGFNFAPQLGAGGLDAGTGSILTQAPIVVAVLAALLAGVSLLPKQKSFKSWVAILAVLALLLVINEIVQAPTGIEVEWGLYVVLALSVLQAGSAVGALLLDAGVIQPPAPRPQADPYNYGGPAQGYNPQAQYYGQQPQQQYGQQTGQHFGQQGGYQPQSQNAPIGGYTGAQSASQHGADSGPPTPPTGFPAFGQPQQSAGQSSAPQQSSGQGPSASETAAGSSSFTSSPSVPGANGSGSEPTTTFQQPPAPQ